MFRKFFFIFLFVFMMRATSYAADVGIITLPKDMDNLTVENFVAAVDESIAIGAGKVVLAGPRWSEMEPRKERYEFDNALGGAAYAAAQGKGKVYLNIQLINTVKRELPSDLMDKKWEDPVLLDRLDKLMAAIKASGKIDPVAVSLGNEVDVYFEKHVDEVEGYAYFLSNAILVVKNHFPAARVGVTMTYEGLEKKRDHIIAALADVSEILFFTYYPVFDFHPLPLQDAPKHLAKMEAIANGKPLVLQEVGFPSGPGEGIGPEMQADFFKNILPLLKQSQKIEAAFIFALHDFSPNICNGFMDYYNAGGMPQDFRDRFASFLCSLGLKDWEGKPKSAYMAVKQALQ